MLVDQCEKLIGMCVFLISVLQNNKSNVKLQKNSKMFEYSQLKYEIEDIIDEAIVKSEPHFLIKWKGLSHQLSTWEPISRLANNSEILKSWLISKRTTQKKTNLNKQQVYNQGFSSRQYTQLNLYSQKIAIPHKKVDQNQLKRKKSELNHPSQVKNCISLISDDQQEDQQGCQGFQQWGISKPQQAKIAKASKLSRIKVGKNSNQQTYFIKSKVKAEKRQANPKETFRVIAAVDPSKIVKICKLFTFRQKKCVQVQYQDGRHMNMKQQDVKKTNPMLLMEYYEMQDIPI